MANILIVDDEPSILKVLSTVLGRAGYSTACVENAEGALKKLTEAEFQVMVSDLRLGQGMDGLELLHEARLRSKKLTVIMITAYGSVDVAVQALKEGAFDFICKPFKLDTLLETVKNAVQHWEQGQAKISEGAVDAVLHFGRLVGDSEKMQDVYHLIERVARTDATVLIQGESGTGKELVAQAIHQSSRRSEGAWIPLNCAALAPSLLESEMFGHAAGSFTGANKTRDGLFMAANKGTLFLDEIGAMDLSIQGKLLRTLQEKKVRRVGENKDMDVDVRVIAATNEPLERKRDAGLFREDLFYRISVIPIMVPPLRQRPSDIPLLVRHFCKLQSDTMQREVKLDESVMAALVGYSWPGNVRELQNAIACASALCHDGMVTVNDLPPHVRGNIEETVLRAAIPAGGDARGRSLREFLKMKEREYLEQIIKKAGGNRVKAAELLGISRATLYRKLPDGAPEEQ